MAAVSIESENVTCRLLSTQNHPFVLLHDCKLNFKQKPNIFGSHLAAILEILVCSRVYQADISRILH